MSSRLLGWAINTVPQQFPELSQPARHLLLLLADHFNDNEGAAWPSHIRLANMMGVDRRSVIRWMHELKEAGIVRQHFRKNKTNLYRLVCDTQSPTPNLEVTHSHVVGDRMSRTQVTQSHTNSYRTLIEPCGDCTNGFIEQTDEAGYVHVKKCPKGCKRTGGTHA